MEPDDDYRYGGDRYELLRARAGFLSGLALPAKVRWCSYLLFADALVLPIVTVLPPAVRATYLHGTPASAQPALAWVAVAGAGVVFPAGLGLAWLTRRRAQLGDLDEAQASWLVGVESMLSSIGFVTGGAAVTVAVAGTAVGFAGAETVAWLGEHGVHPYRPAGGPPVGGVAAAAVVLAVVLAVVARRVGAAER